MSKEQYSPYKQTIPMADLTLKIIPIEEKFTVIPNRLFYYLTKSRGADVWKRCSQGKYNLMAASGYYVTYVDNAVIFDEED